jgi:hypothetical protein
MIWGTYAATCFRQSRNPVKCKCAFSYGRAISSITAFEIWGILLQALHLRSEVPIQQQFGKALLIKKMKIVFKVLMFSLAIWAFDDKRPASNTFIPVGKELGLH